MNLHDFRYSDLVLGSALIFAEMSTQFVFSIFHFFSFVVW